MGQATLIDRYRRWFEYEKDAHIKVIASLDTVPTENRSLPAYQKALTLVAHIMLARQLWLSRFGAGGEKPSDFFPAGQNLPDVIDRVEKTHTAWSAYLRRLNDADLSRVFEYESLEGGRFRNTVEDILTQLFGHSWYHRGQIATLVRSAGGEPAATDFIFWTREPIK